MADESAYVTSEDEDLIAAIDAAEQTSYSSEGDTELSSDRALAIRLYNGENVDPAPEGRSQITDQSVFETIQWIKPSLTRIFANGDDVVELPPVSEEDEPAAKQEGQYLNYVILRKNNWFEIFDTWSQDAMLSKNGYCLAYSEERINREVDEYKRQTEQGVVLLASDKDVEVEILEEYPDPDYVEPPPPIDPMTGMPAIDPMTGMPAMPPPPPMLYDVRAVRVRTERKICLKVLPPERCKISYRTPSFRLADCPYFEYYDFKTLSDLRADGFDVPEDMPQDWEIDQEEDLARDQYGEQEYRDNNNEPDETLKRYRVRMIWMLHDLDQDGIAERIYAVRIGRKILYKIQCSRIPVSCMVCIPNAHRHIAVSIADKTSDIQRTKTAILRQGLDNLYLANNPQKFINDKINLDDALVSRPGGIVRGEQGAIFGQDIAPFTLPFVFPQAMEGLEYMDQVRENRTGTNRYFTGIDQNAMNKTATGIQQLSTMAAQRVEQIARIMAIAVEDLFSIVHELILKAGHKKETVKLTNKWVDVDPAQWKTRTDFRISVGYAAGNKDALVARLMMLANMQKEALMGGLPIVTPENAYETAIELTKASDFSAPNRFWTNPEQMPEKPPPQPDVTLTTIENIKAQTSSENSQRETEQRERDSQRDAQVKMHQIDTDATVKLALARQQDERADRNSREERQHQAVMEDRKVTGQLTIKGAPDANASERKQLQEMMAELRAMQADLAKRMNGSGASA